MPVDGTFTQFASHGVCVNVVDGRENCFRLCQIAVVAGAFLPETKGHHPRSLTDRQPLEQPAVGGFQVFFDPERTRPFAGGQQ